MSADNSHADRKIAKRASTPIVDVVRMMHEEDDKRDPYNSAPMRRDSWARALAYTTDQVNRAEMMLRGSRLTLEE